MHQSNLPPSGEDVQRTTDLLGKSISDLGDDASQEDLATIWLGQILSESAERHLPESSDSLRETLIQELDRPTSVPADCLVTPISIQGESPRAWQLWMGGLIATASAVFLITMIARSQTESRQGFAMASQEADISPATVPKSIKPELPTHAKRDEISKFGEFVEPGVVVKPGEVLVELDAKPIEVHSHGQEQERFAKQLSQLYTLEKEGARAARAAQLKKYRILPDSNRPAHSQSGSWATDINRAWLEELPAPKLPAESMAGTHAGEVDDVTPQSVNRVFRTSKLTNGRMVVYEWNPGDPVPRIAPMPEELTKRVDPLFREAEIPFYETYESPPENDFLPARQNPRSTFSIDVDTASYTNVRRFLTEQRLPPPNAVRVEEFLNYFSYDYPQPKGDDPFSVHMEVAACPWTEGNKLIHIGLKGKEIKTEKRPPSNIVFLLDVSGSMNKVDKLPLLKRGLKMMVQRLREDDFVSIVTYAGNAGVALEPTSGDQTDRITGVIDALQSGGSTNGSAGIDRAYELAAEHFVKGGTNRVILATDGDLNVGITNDDELVKLIQSKAGEGVFLTVLGFGTGNLKDAKMEKLADNGNGVYAYIDSVREARKVLVQQMSENLVTIAKDVKLQLEFNPRLVRNYRLIGYENRVLANKDFDNDAKDAGEIGAGHTVTALYEIIPAEEQSGEDPEVKPAKLKYQDMTAELPDEEQTRLSDAANSDELLTLALRYKQPDANTSKRIEFICKDAKTKFKNASASLRFASSVAAFGMMLRKSKHVGSANHAWCEEAASSALGEDQSGYRSEFVDLVRTAKVLSNR